MSAFSPRQMFLLDEACKPIADAFDATPYLVGTALVPSAGGRGDYRDVDVRLMLTPERYDALHAVTADLIPFLGIAIGQHLASITGLPIDFQIQHADVANTRHHGNRNPLGLRTLANYRGDAHPEA
ncbi:hypothetical protein GA0004736_3403 [Curtobacterium sp. 9128]|uniref:hypothetical protein n=1 Tax=Curtobacterium sp. 9128 TaxID=1793722 RepID=UPI0007D7330C|nr:hypothetical protein [Curtobacterium sp. 9128]SBN64443.1 hypothetical protein GA0004736_3403 [Curtobacterium sp. 9128]